MTKTLFLLRHAKTKVVHPGQADRDRRLRDRGWADLKQVSATLDHYGQNIDLILCSTAVRTQETVDGLTASCVQSSDVTLDDALYNADMLQLLKQVHKTSDDAAALMIVGHNPGVHELAFSLAMRASLKGHSDLQSHFPTSALAILTFDVASWGQVVAGEGTLREFAVPV